MGPPPINTLAAPVARDGGWGVLSGGWFALADDEAMIVNIDAAGAGYTGFQALTEWFMAPDARTTFTTRNNAQSTPDPDGTFTYVMTLRDPGYANWVGTAGCHEGMFAVRWQVLRPGTDVTRLLRRVEVVKLKDLADVLPERLSTVTAREREHEMAQRIHDYDTRVRE